jgi:plastocyanin
MLAPAAVRQRSHQEEASMSRAPILIRAAIVLGLAAVGLASGAAGATPAAQEVVVEMASGPTRFEPAEIVVAPGTTVVWQTVSGSHTSTSEDGHWDTGRRLPVGESFAFTFVDPGEYAYYCEPHKDQGMVGKVLVRP